MGKEKKPAYGCQKTNRLWPAYVSKKKGKRDLKGGRPEMPKPEADMEKKNLRGSNKPENEELGEARELQKSWGSWGSKDKSAWGNKGSYWSKDKSSSGSKDTK